MNVDEGAIAELIAELAGDDANQAEEAQAALKAYGVAALLPLMEVTPQLHRFGQLCAIELFEDIGDPRASPVLIPMLRSEDHTVREWAARALGRLGVHEAVSELQLAYEAVKLRRTPLAWTEPQAIRVAMTTLGARTEIVPATVRELTHHEPTLGRCWLLDDLREVVEALAQAHQVILSFSFWKRWRDSYTWVETPSWELDWSRPWGELVESARSGALVAAARAGNPKDTVAVVTWLDESDR